MVQGKKSENRYMTREARGDALSSQCVCYNSCCIQEHHVRSDKLAKCVENSSVIMLSRTYRIVERSVG
jgi:hypothetical protein